MDVDLIGRPGEMGARMAAMDPRMRYEHADGRVWPAVCDVGDHDGGDDVANDGADLAVLRDLMMSADGTRQGGLGCDLAILRWVALRADRRRSTGAAFRRV